LFNLPLAEAPAEENPAAATGLLVKDYRGKDANQVVWKFDSALESNIMEALKLAAIEEGQWTEKRDLTGGVGIDVMKERLNAGRQRVADAKKARDAKEALESKIMEALKQAAIRGRGVDREADYKLMRILVRMVRTHVWIPRSDGCILPGV